MLEPGFRIEQNVHVRNQSRDKNWRMVQTRIIGIYSIVLIEPRVWIDCEYETGVTLEPRLGIEPFVTVSSRLYIKSRSKSSTFSF